MFGWFLLTQPQLIPTWSRINVNGFKCVGLSLQRRTRDVSDGSCRSNFLGLGQLIISRAVFPPPSSGRWQSPSVFIYPLSMSLHHPAHASATHSPPTRPRYLLLLAPPAGLVLVSVVPRNGWSTFDGAPEGVCCYLTQDFSIVMRSH